MRRLFLAAAIAILSSFAAKGAEKGAVDIVFGPWIQNVTDNSFTVLWTSSEKVLAWLDVDRADGPGFYQKDRTRYYQDIVGRHYAGTFHSIEVTGLEPGTEYRFRIAGQVVEDESTNAHAINFGPQKAVKKYFVVKTLDSKAEKCRFCVVNDIHANDARYKALMAPVKREDVDFVVLNGDMVSVVKEIDTLIKHTFVPMAELAAGCPIVYARGNHEGRGADWYLTPKVFPTPTGEFYYTFRQGPCAFVVLDAGEDKPDNDVEYSGTAAFDAYRAKELEWLKGALKDPAFTSAPHKICIMHIPTFNEKNTWYTQKWITENFAPLLNAAGVKLMISGHHHHFILKQPGDYNNRYTIYVNACDERLDVVADSRTISLRSYSTDGTLMHSLDL